MDTDNTHTQTTLSTDYPRGKLADALVTALTHVDADVRQRAEKRARDWQHVIEGMADGTLTIGSPTPATGIPAWVTLEILHGGFATRTPAAGGPLLPYETELIRQHDLPNNRIAVFAYYLTEAGMRELNAMLDSGEYTVEQPEEAALLTLAWLLRAKDHNGAAVLLDTIAPWADRVRFAPRPSRTAVGGLSLAWRYTAGEIRQRLATKRVNERIEKQREALTVWKPFGDELLAHWLETLDDAGRVAAQFPAGWMDRGRNLLARYELLTQQHTLCRPPHSKKGNFSVLWRSLHDVVSDVALDNRLRGLLQLGVDGMVAKRGKPGSRQLTALRAEQAAEASRPSHYNIAQVLVQRLAALPQGEGIRSLSDVIRPVGESESPAVRAGAVVPASIVAVVQQGVAAPVHKLITVGIVPSAEVLAQLVPQITAAVTAAEYSDPALRTLMAAVYRAFRNRRSVLLLNLHHQVTIDQLPWVQVARRHADIPATGQNSPAAQTLTELAWLAISSFPGTILPNPFIRELSMLARHAELDLPLVEELAADIFMGTFTQKFANATLIAADLLADSLYDRYYGIGYTQIASVLRESAPTKRDGYYAYESTVFADLCRSRAGSPGRTVPGNGMVIEQSQILTTHNLAVLVRGIRRDDANSQDWLAMAGLAYQVALNLIAWAHQGARPLNAVKDAAYAWRQMLFFLSMADEKQHIDFVNQATDNLMNHPDHVAQRMGPVLAGLSWVLGGRSLDEANAVGRRFTGWSDRGHWMFPRR